MDATKASAKSDAADAAEAEGPAPAPSERARAHAYLDLWERQVVHVALHGPAPGSNPIPGRPPA
jgi:hypothetical protein